MPGPGGPGRAAGAGSERLRGRGWQPRHGAALESRWFRLVPGWFPRGSAAFPRAQHYCRAAERTRVPGALCRGGFAQKKLEMVRRLHWGRPQEEEEEESSTS